MKSNKQEKMDCDVLLDKDLSSAASLVDINQKIRLAIETGRVYRPANGLALDPDQDLIR